MSLLLYVLGFIVIVTGLAWLATVAGISQAYILVAVAILLCVGAFTALTTAVANKGQA